MYLEQMLQGTVSNSLIENARNDKEFWEFIVEKEIQFTKLEGTLDCGMNIIYVVQKNNICNL